MKVRRWLVHNLERLCANFGHPFSCKLGWWSYNLDEHWNLNVWERIGDGPEDKAA